ncbi:MAG: hypothetical protein LBR15_08725 [Methanobrevibacter sp.]|nr:hypothetical protein [Candidatus Methanovirga australis]
MGFDVSGEKLIKHGRIDGVFKDYDNNRVIICEVKYSQVKRIVFLFIG